MRFCSLGSGSGGNATLVEASQGITQTRLLIDCGFSLRELTRRLGRAGCQPESLDAIFITHEHGDHVGCALALAQRYRLTLVTSRGTWGVVGSTDFDPKLLRLVRSLESVELGDLSIRPFAVPHDAAEPLQLRAHDGAAQFGVITDLGSTPDFVKSALQGCHALLLECNHDEALLQAGHYPPALKRRILGSHGHLSNGAAATLLADVAHEGLHTVVAAHLSERNNTPALARAALAPAWGVEPDTIRVAGPASGCDWITV